MSYTMTMSISTGFQAISHASRRCDIPFSVAWSSAWRRPNRKTYQANTRATAINARTVNPTTLIARQ